ncbi:HET-domain-containing protein [Epithele typhae]|uniref:HET-domain-containing protein n=1 Tax=Epithele typhae TaxID=378194 RepID=UPI00200854BD|nr:HET-domain-containing protein [Epithele typhae]KAH9937846.1 HET-domain-containing protein [Epithele typhae]
MWLLSTDRAELHFFSTPAAVTGGYAILSHTWEDDHEQTYQEIRGLQERCKASGKNPRDMVSSKIRQTCLLAKRYSFDWVWVDTCCIDKTSSTELSEAINSMFRWYAASEVCFAYLADVPSDDVVDAPGSAFLKARWHTRGWTLQELIAPLLVLFVSRDWKIIGNKLELGKLLNSITGILDLVLTNQASYSTVGVASRISWAAHRQTTRVEDEAYCLMGLFNVNMPTIYGEGKHAFQRLQQGIMRQSFDTSLFAWGRWISHNSQAVPMARNVTYNIFHAPSLDHFFLLSQSVKAFANSRGLRYSPNATYPLQPYLPYQWKPIHNEPEDGEKRTVGPFGALELPQFQNTNYGMKCRFPVFEVKGVTVAMLMTDNAREHFGLLLNPTNDNLTDPSRVRYSVGWGFDLSDNRRSFVRLVHMGKDWYNLSFLGEPVKPVWRDIHIMDTFPEYRKVDRVTLAYPLHTLLPASPFRIPHWLINRLLLLDFEASNKPMIKSSQKDGPGTPLVVQMSFDSVAQTEGIRLRFGTCFPLLPPPAPAGPGQGADTAEDQDGNPGEPARGPEVHWATAQPMHAANWRTTPPPIGHDCATDHVDGWPGWAREFVDEEGARVVRLSFLRSPFAPESTRVFHLELAGGSTSR